MHDTTQAAAPRTGHFLPIARLGLLAMMLALAACKGGKPGDGKGEDGKDAANKGPEAVPVEVAKAGRRSIAASYAGSAPLEARGEAQVVAKTSGIALRVFADVGQQVRAGQPLVQIDRDRAALQVAQADAQVRKLEANYRRASQLVEQKMVSVNDVEQLRYDLENARASLRLARLELSYGTVNAPISGVVATRNIKPGNLVQINTPIFTIVDNSRLEATLNAPEREIETLKAGQTVQLSVDALPGKTFAGRIDRVSPVVDSGSGTFRVICAFDGGGLLQPGMFGRIRIEYDQRANALVIPRTALLEDGSSPAVYTVKADKATRVALKLGYVDGEWVEVRDGLRQGDPVVIAGKAALREGSAVQVIGAGASTKSVATTAPAQAAAQ
ncbi:MAG TPA: efflux RND transporter periplasmic adaptor subunit [Thermomonas sp.]|jgi:membrane fusion protein (multidrug efflux system)|nr:efflux RND transporter periplasmic adaptor subunit [Thermomonas sp.]HOZ24700.1 efflux RND transporter periplasmic adaptor subunit [Thermomonas sp.]HPM57806.1 efflux RND transporter periplasmic adaptor subunit [Thermomonas sp.]HPW12125.1 efflux RND transporter periplasmic adaptor subunit [Thermomonas sp.]